MENTIDNKKKFFALYWGQDVALVTKGSYTHPKDTKHVVCGQVINSLTSYVKHNYSLELLPVALIQEDEVVECFRKGLQSIDYMRSKGYALPYMDLSVDDLISYRWIKLKTD